MGLLNVRDLLAFPGGDNLTDTVVNGVHFNKTALDFFNYTLYTNNTLSNASNCYLVFDTYQPFILSNGTFINGTTCFAPIRPLALRGRLGAIFAGLFGISLFLTLVNLKKHGQQFLREDQRFRLVGRRWQWYWMLIVGAFGLISCITGIDVDRNYLQDLALILQSFFFMMLSQATVAAVWEGVRHWGSWQERQIVDRDPFSLPQDDSRGKMEFYMPLIFYFFTFMSFFLTAPRSWSKIPKQGGVEQQNAVARPAATDGRFKAGSLFLCVSWFVILYCVQHNLLYYRLRAHPSLPMPARRSTISVATALRHLPIRYTLSIALITVPIGYNVACAWIFDISIMKYDVWPVWPFTLAYTPEVLVLFILGIWGFLEPNEDKQLIQQRVDRGRRADEDLGIAKKPGWWSKAGGDHHLDDMSRLRGLVADANISSNNRRSRHSRGSLPGTFELTALGGGLEAGGARGETRYTDNVRGRDSSNRSLSTEGGLLSPGESTPPTPHARRDYSPSTMSMASAVTGTTLNGERQQTIRSMLDV